MNCFTFALFLTLQTFKSRVFCLGYKGVKPRSTVYKSRMCYLLYNLECFRCGTPFTLHVSKDKSLFGKNCESSLISKNTSVLLDEWFPMRRSIQADLNSLKTEPEFWILKLLRGQRFKDKEELQEAARTWVCSPPKDWFHENAQKLPERWQSCTDLGGEYTGNVEALSGLSVTINSYLTYLTEKNITKKDR